MWRPTLLLAALLPLWTGACGKMGDPLPPVLVYPDTIHDLRIEQGKNGPRLIFHLPFGDVRYVEIYRLCPPQLVEERAQLIARLFQDQLMEARQVNMFAFEDGDSASQDGCRYALKFVDEKGFSSQYSNFVEWSRTAHP